MRARMPRRPPATATVFSADQANRRTNKQWAMVILLGCVLGAVGLREASTGQLIIPRPGARSSAKIEGLSLAFIGSTMVVVAALFLAGLPTWLTFGVGVLAAVGTLFFPFTPRPSHPNGTADPEVDPDAAERRRPPFG